MRLLNTRTLTLTTFIGEVPEYVILSHRWEAEELVFEDVMKEPISNISSPARAKRGFSKVQGTCALAIKDGFDWVWIDSCCIDKSSSAELQEAINSMFRWYQEAQICYAYLSDVTDEQAGCGVPFEQSLWFTRGWTLQELLAPSSVEFYAADWAPIGSKASRAPGIALITGIDLAALENNWYDLKDRYFAAEKMSWAAHRLVTRTEDMAYCLLGLFDANMPLLYGEGGRKAFRRLQQVVFESEADYTLFLFATNESADAPWLAYSTRQFCRKASCRDCAREPTCLPSHIAYSQIRSGHWARWSAFNDPSLKLVKGGVKLKVPQVDYTPDLKVQRLSSTPTMTPGRTGRTVALLPVSLVEYEEHLFGIILRSLPTLDYIRYNAAPILVDMRSLGISNFDPMTLMVSDNAMSSVDAGRDYARFEIRSSSFQVSSWTCTTDSYEHPRKPGTIITNAKATSDRFALRIKTSSTASGVSPIIVLGGSIQRLHLQSVEIQSDEPTTRFVPALEHASRLDRMSIRLASRRGLINVALRRLCTTCAKDPNVNGVGARYRVDVEFVGDDILDLEVGMSSTETGDMDTDELPVHTTAAGCIRWIIFVFVQ